MTALSLEENERNYFPRGKIARVVCAGKEGTRKVITGIDGHTVHGQTLRVRRLMEVVPGHGESLGGVQPCVRHTYGVCVFVFCGRRRARLASSFCLLK